MDTKRLRHLAGMPVNESMEADMGSEMEADMDMEMSDEGGETCPFCGTPVEAGGMAEHIRNDHADIIEYYEETHGTGDEEYDDTADAEATEFPDEM